MNTGERTVALLLIFSLVGTSLLYLQLPEVQEAGAGELREGDVGRSLRFSGVVTDARDVEGGVVFTLRDDTGEVKVVLWGEEAPAEGSVVEVRGRVEEYRGGLEVVAERVETPGSGG